MARSRWSQSTSLKQSCGYFFISDSRPWAISLLAWDCTGWDTLLVILFSYVTIAMSSCGNIWIGVLMYLIVTALWTVPFAVVSQTQLSCWTNKSWCQRRYLSIWPATSWYLNHLWKNSLQHVDCNECLSTWRLVLYVNGHVSWEAAPRGCHSWSLLSSWRFCRSQIMPRRISAASINLRAQLYRSLPKGTFARRSLLGALRSIGRRWSTQPRLLLEHVFNCMSPQLPTGENWFAYLQLARINHVW